MEQVGIIKSINIEAVKNYFSQFTDKYDIPDFINNSVRIFQKSLQEKKMTSTDAGNACSSFFDLYRNAWPSTMEHHIEELHTHLAYAEKYGQPLTYVYADKKTVLFSVYTYSFAIPNDPAYIEIEPYRDYSDIPVNRILAQSNMSEVLPACKDDRTKNEMTESIKEQENKIASAMEELERKKQEKEQEIESFKAQIEQKYAQMLAELDEKKQALELEKQKMEQELFVLDTKIYGIRCFFGETVNFTLLTSGRRAQTEEPVVLYQKIRFLDEELAKYISLYDVDGDDTGLFEELIKTRQDMRELFFPGEKSVSLVRISRDGNIYVSGQDSAADGRGNVFVSNVLRQYKVFHGSQIGILIRDGENCYIGWTDTDRINVTDGNAFLTPKKASVDEVQTETMWGREKEKEAQSSSKEEVTSRYFIFSILQGVVLNSKILLLPEGIDIIHADSRYVIFSTADAWLSDNRYGTFSDIVRNFNRALQKGDYILTLRGLCANGQKYGAYYNDRGRGYKNRTHDVYAKDNTIYPVNYIEKEPCKLFSYEFRKERNFGKELPDTDAAKKWEKEQRKSEYQTVEEFLSHMSDDYGFRNILMEDSFEQTVYVSLEKGENWETGKKSRANFELYSDEYLNLTFLNTVLLKYVITTRNLGARDTYDGRNFSGLLPYLNRAMEFLKEREKEEEKLLSKYMNLPNEWQMDVSRFKMEKNVHRLSDYQAKRFCKWYEQHTNQEP